MAYLSRMTGKVITEEEHIRQSVNDIFSTPIGSRVRRRDYGFPHELIDLPMNRRNVLRIYSAAAKALNKWEPRLQVKRFQADVANGVLTLIIERIVGSSIEVSL